MYVKFPYLVVGLQYVLDLFPILFLGIVRLSVFWTTYDCFSKFSCKMLCSHAACCIGSVLSAAEICWTSKCSAVSVHFQEALNRYSASASVKRLVHSADHDCVAVCLVGLANGSLLRVNDYVNLQVNDPVTWLSNKLKCASDQIGFDKN